MATMAKKNGKWTVYWTDGAGKKRSKVVSTRKRDAERFLARLVDDADTPGLRRGIDPATGDLVLERDGVRVARALAEALA